MKYQAPVKHIMFLVDEWIGLEKLNVLPGYEHVDRETFEFILEEAGRFCSEELLPLNRQADEVGAVFENGAVTTPPGFREAYRKFCENGWTAIDADPAHGGQGLPKLVQFQVDEMLCACNLAFKLYAELSHGAYHLMSHAAPPQWQERCLAKMVEGRWSGTMCLTEPQCGTDLGLLTTRATPGEDGHYSITGTKIFITSGDHDLTENILHMVLARIDGAPQGAGGISLFLVPKFLINDDGSVGHRNGVTTGSIEHKMGIRGSATCVLNFDAAHGILLGEANHGLSAMFKMMNLERITVGIQGLGFAEIAWQNALAYAQERRQSRAVPPRPGPGKAADPIIYQPEIRNKLLRIRCQLEGGRALAVFTGFHADLMEKAPGQEARERSAGIVALLTPVVKSFLSDLGVEATLEAQQVFGGHGYIREHGMEQLVRDARIAPIYEGTNEVQAADLVRRKITLDGGSVADRFFDELEQNITAMPSQQGITHEALAALGRLREVTGWIREKLESDPAVAAGAASQYQRLFALTIIGCLWADICATIDGKQGDFYAARRRLASFYIRHLLVETGSLAKLITEGAPVLSSFEDHLFEA